MNILMWILQGVLAFLCLSGGGFKLAKPSDVAGQIPAVPEIGWRVIGLFEVVAALLLIVPLAFNLMPQLTAIAAVAMVVESVGLSLLYASYSRKLTAANPLVFAVPMGLMALGIAFGRSALLSL